MVLTKLFLRYDENCLHVFYINHYATMKYEIVWGNTVKNTLKILIFSFV